MRKIIFILGYLLTNPKVLLKFIKIQKYKKLNQHDIYQYQFENTKKYLIFAYENTRYYRECFDQIGFNPYEFSSLEEMKNIPILTKGIIRERPLDFITSIGEPYQEVKSGGSTGEPLKYRLSKNDAAWSRALLFNGFSLGGYKLGDSILTIAGGSLVPDKFSFKQNAMNFILNQETISALNITSADYSRIVKRIIDKRAKFIRGYSSSLFRLSEYILENNIDIKNYPKAIFTTSETLLEKHRNVIEKAFQSKVYDQYGLNDSGASAFEISSNQYLLDFERSLVELIPEGDSHKIITTSYSNKAMVFLRYDTGDNCIVIENTTQNKVELNEIIGKSTESLKINGVDLSVPRLIVLFGDLNINRFQIVQKQKSIIFHYSGHLNSKDKDYIYEVFSKTAGDINVDLKSIKNEEFKVTQNGKHKYIIYED